MDVQELIGPLDDYLLQCLGAGKSLKTIDHYSRVIKAFIHEFGPDEVTPHAINAYLARLRETCRSSTVNSYCRALRTFFNYLLAEGLLDRNPMASIKTPPVSEGGERSESTMASPNGRNPTKRQAKTVDGKPRFTVTQYDLLARIILSAQNGGGC